MAWTRRNSSMENFEFLSPFTYSRHEHIDKNMISFPWNKNPVRHVFYTISTECSMIERAQSLEIIEKDRMVSNNHGWKSFFLHEKWHANGVQLIAAKSPLSWTWREKGRIATGDSNRLNRRWLIPKWPDRTNLICEKTYRAFALPERMKRFVSMSMKDALIYILSVLFGAWPSSAQRKASSLLPKRTTWTL